MARFASEAERFRAHREAFELALELGCTPAAAAHELRRRRAAASDQEATRRLAAKVAESAPCQTAAARWDAPWMLRD